MLTLATAGLKPCETTDGPSSSYWSLCTNPADKYGAALGSLLYTTHRATRSVAREIKEEGNV